MLARWQRERTYPVLMQRQFRGEHRRHDHLSLTNLLNAGLIVAVCVVWKASVDILPRLCEERADHFSLLAKTCTEPLLAVSILLFIDVSVLFWCIGLLQRSFWLIDPFWTWIPLMIAYAYLNHPALPPTPLSVRVYWVLGLLGLWAVRLTHSYFRREQWKFGEREDWRYTLLAKKCGSHWWWISFWAVGVLQQLLLTGLTFPVLSVLFRATLPWSVLDSVAVVLCLMGIGIAFSADTDLHHYVTSRPRRHEILRAGMWRYSRHPNYFGEQLFWWSLCLFSVGHGDVWALSGPLFNSVILAETTRMTEERMIQNWSANRTALYRKYQRNTSAWIPWGNQWDE